MRERHEETVFRWPADGNAINLTRDVLASISTREIVDSIIPNLCGRAVLACWLLANGADATEIRKTLNIGTDTLRAYCGAIMQAAQEHTEDTYIALQGGTP